MLRCLRGLAPGGPLARGLAPSPACALGAASFRVHRRDSRWPDVPGRRAGGYSTAAHSIKELIAGLSTKPLLPPPPPLVLVISGGSGVGKDSVLRALARRRPELHFVVTATTRQPRPGEREGVDYTFVTRPKFERWIADGELIEHAVVYGEYKGVPKAAVAAATRRRADCVLRLDVQGAATIRAVVPNVVTVFLVAESEAAHARRLAARGTEDPEQLLVRLRAAQAENAAISDFDYAIVNRDNQLDLAVRQIEAIIDAEKVRVREE